MGACSFGGAPGGSWRRWGSAGLSCGTLAPALSGEIDPATAYCQRMLQAQGADVHVVDVGDVDHSTSVILSVPLVPAQFDQLGAGH